MKVFANKMLYAARVKAEERYIGVFSSIENAKNAGADEYEVIYPTSFTADVALPKYVCMAEGSWMSMTMVDGECITNRYLIDPVWGFSIQSAVLALFGYQASKKFVRLSKLYIYEINKPYCESQPSNVAAEFSFIVLKYENNAAIGEEMLSADYIAMHFLEAKRKEAYRKRLDSQEVKLILEKLNENVINNLEGRKYGLNENEAEWTRRNLAARFSERELRLAAVALKVMEDEALSEQIEKGSISKDEINELIKKVKRCLYIANRGCRRSKRLTEYLD